MTQSSVLNAFCFFKHSAVASLVCNIGTHLLPIK